MSRHSTPRAAAAAAAAATPQFVFAAGWLLAAIVALAIAAQIG